MERGEKRRIGKERGKERDVMVDHPACTVSSFPKAGLDHIFAQWGASQHRGEGRGKRGKGKGRGGEGKGGRREGEKSGNEREGKGKQAYLVPLVSATTA